MPPKSIQGSRGEGLGVGNVLFRTKRHEGKTKDPTGSAAERSIEKALGEDFKGALQKSFAGLGEIIPLTREYAFIPSDKDYLAITIKIQKTPYSREPTLEEDPDLGRKTARIEPKDVQIIGGRMIIPVLLTIDAEEGITRDSRENLSEQMEAIIRTHAFI